MRRARARAFFSLAPDHLAIDWTQTSAQHRRQQEKTKKKSVNFPHNFHNWKLAQTVGQIETERMKNKVKSSAAGNEMKREHFIEIRQIKNKWICRITSSKSFIVTVLGDGEKARTHLSLHQRQQHKKEDSHCVVKTQQQLTCERGEKGKKGERPTRLFKSTWTFSLLFILIVFYVFRFLCECSFGTSPEHTRIKFETWKDIFCRCRCCCCCCFRCLAK